jgi:hypothetical protein
MKRMLLMLGTAVLIINTLVLPTVMRADGGATSTNCGKTMCKP